MIFKNKLIFLTIILFSSVSINGAGEDNKSTWTQEIFDGVRSVGVGLATYYILDSAKYQRKKIGKFMGIELYKEYLLDKDMNKVIICLSANFLNILYPFNKNILKRAAYTVLGMGIGGYLKSL